MTSTIEALDIFFRENPRFALAYSGGTDSAFLLCAALRFGVDVHAYIVRSEFQPRFELEQALSLFGTDVPVTVLDFSALSVPELRGNDELRCYYCKRRILSMIKEQAAVDGYTLVCDGSNASDRFESRPGMRALEEMGVCSPLRLCGLDKKEIRRLSRLAGLPTADKPSYSCLATRIRTGQEITDHALRRIEDGEAMLFELGFSDFRLRLWDGAFRLELLGAQLEKGLSMADKLRGSLGELSIVERKVENG